MKHALVFLACSISCLGIYFWVGYPSNVEAVHNKQAVTISRDNAPAQSVEIFQPALALGLSEQRATADEELSVEPLSAGEYIDAMGPMRSNDESEPVTTGEFLDAMDLGGSNSYESDPLSVGDYIDISNPEASFSYGGEAESIGEYIPVGAETRYLSGEEPLSVGEYVDLGFVGGG